MNPSNSTSSDKKPFDWTIVLEVVVKILTIGLGHVRKHKNTDAKDTRL